MTSNRIFKRLIPMVLAGAAMLVLAMPMTASARDWDHDNGRHNGWVHRDRDDFHHKGWVDHDRDYFRPAPRAYYPNNYYGYAPAYGRGYAGGCGNLSRLQNVYRQDLATGHPAAANDVARQMRTCGGVSSAYPYPGYFGQNGSVFAPLLGNFRAW
ncbi:MAG: hypothetical protein JO121_01165 [Deltaproteobacteria bacterium]|jgi:hypothetical protein|nr:hypothetical protein [Deltaproteobacteria bacterium]